ncbi:MAG: TlpA family protein disulfide reductase [Bryobacter sp.]|jgi:peroxiredoxin|nr:TlpA family protein disulfide reductase [Bryobacter sp.]
MLITVVLATALAQPAPDAAELLRSTARQYRSLGPHEFIVVLEQRFERPDDNRVTRNRMHEGGADARRWVQRSLDPDNGSRVIANGETYVVFDARSNTYTERRFDPEHDAPAAFHFVRNLDRDAATARWLRRETLTVEGKPIDTQVVQTTSQREIRDGKQTTTTTVWIDAARNLVLKLEQRNRGGIPPFEWAMIHTYERARLAAPDDPALARLSPPAGARLVKELPVSQPPPHKLAGQAAPAWALPDLSGTVHSLAALRGRPVLLFFWNSRCGTSCRDWMVEVELVRRGAKGLTVLAIADGEEAALRESFAEGGYGYPCLLDVPGAVRRQYAINAPAATVLIGPDGVVRTIHEGYWRTREVVESLQALNAW